MVSTNNVQITYSEQVYKRSQQKLSQIMFLIKKRRSTDTNLEVLSSRNRLLLRSFLRTLALMTQVASLPGLLSRINLKVHILTPEIQKWLRRSLTSWFLSEILS